MGFETIPSAQDVIAVRVEGKLEHKELQAIMDLVERTIAINDKTHIFVEVGNFRGMELRLLLDDIARAMPILKKLKRFGRVAVVSDQKWIRAMARIESALLPNISYEVFEPTNGSGRLRGLKATSRIRGGAANLDGSWRRAAPSGIPAEAFVDAGTPAYTALVIDSLPYPWRRSAGF